MKKTSNTYMCSFVGAAALIFTACGTSTDTSSAEPVATLEAHIEFNEGFTTSDDLRAAVVWTNFGSDSVAVDVAVTGKSLGKVVLPFLSVPPASSIKSCQEIEACAASTSLDFRSAIGQVILYRDKNGNKRFDLATDMMAPLDESVETVVGANYNGMIIYVESSQAVVDAEGGYTLQPGFNYVSYLLSGDYEAETTAVPFNGKTVAMTIKASNQPTLPMVVCGPHLLFADENPEIAAIMECMNDGSCLYAECSNNESITGLAVRTGKVMDLCFNGIIFSEDVSYMVGDLPDEMICNAGDVSLGEILAMYTSSDEAFNTEDDFLAEVTE